MEKKSIEKLHFQLSELKEKISNGLKIKVPQNAVAGTCIRVKFPSNWTTLCDNLIAELASAQKPPCEHACILCPNGFGLQDFQEGGVECDESDDGIDSANIISDKREKRSVERYQDDEYKKLLLDDIPPEELNAALEDEVSSSDEEEIEVRSDDEEWKEDDEEEWKEDDEEWKEDDEEWKEDDEEDRRLRETCGW
jgi:hypothetical protein